MALVTLVWVVASATRLDWTGRNWRKTFNAKYALSAGLRVAFSVRVILGDYVI